MYTTSHDDPLVRNGTQSQFVMEWVVLFGQDIKFFSFLDEFQHGEGRTLRYPCFNDFNYDILGKYQYSRYIMCRYTSLSISLNYLQSLEQLTWLTTAK